MRKCGLPVTHAGAAYPFAYDDKNCRTRNCFLSAAVLFQSVFSKCDETVQQFHGNAFLAHDLQLLCVIRSNKCHYISVCAEACSGDLDIIGDDHVEILFPELASRLVFQIGGLHGKSAEDLSRTLVLSQILQGILCALQVQAQVVVSLFDLLIADCGRPVIGDGSGLDDDILLIGYRGDCIKQIARGCDRDQLYSRGGSEGDRP